MNQAKFIRSHSARVKQAEEYRKNSPEKISIIDREALVEFYLLEDVVHLYEYRLASEEKKVVQTHAGELAKKANIAKFSAIIKIFNSAIEIAWGAITAGNFSDVWSAVPEHALMVAAGSIKNLPQLRDLAIRLLKRLSGDARLAEQQSTLLDDSLTELEDHDANVRRVMGLPSMDEIDAIINEIEIAIPDNKSRAQIKPNKN